MLSSCDFQLNNPHGIYYSGQTISGTIVLKIPSSMDIESINIRFLGEARVTWEETQNYEKDGEIGSLKVDFHAMETFVDNSILVRGPGQLSEGTYDYAINILLLHNCPSSCEGKFGYIRYTLSLIIDEGQSSNKKFKKIVTVFLAKDLNVNPAYKVPIQAEETTSLGCCLCTNEKITYILRIPFGAYVVGQILRYSLLIENQSLTDINGYVVQFNELMIFEARLPHRRKQETKSILVHQIYENKCLRLSNKEFRGEIILPSLIPDTDGSGIIQIQHSLDFVFETDDSNVNKTISVPIVIGTEAIRESLMPTDDRFTSTETPIPYIPGNMNEPPAYGDICT
ncbi:arrestin domain-containing protein 3-like [Haematobia irritans]|uniref:arrestin domain-containing protein 3-like n=1 Tax=Haematobia irritans TaxID=7368 RepID=UPI003F4FA739